MRKRFCLRQGIVLISDHRVLSEGQFVEIVLETETSYVVRSGNTGEEFTLDKKNIELK